MHGLITSACQYKLTSKYWTLIYVWSSAVHEQPSNIIDWRFQLRFLNLISLCGKTKHW